MDVTLEFLNAAYGDAILVSWGDPPHLAIVDGGPTGSFELALGPRLEQLRAERTTGDDPLVVDLVSVSHIDDDHIAGVVRFLGNIRRRSRDGLSPVYQVRRLWHNSFEELIAAGPHGASIEDITADVDPMAHASGAIAASVNQGRDVRDLARALGVAGNQPFGGPVIGGSSTTIGGLVVTIAAPDPTALENLETTWRTAKERKDPSVLAAAFDDRSVPNLSSTCIVLGGPQGRAILTADARGDRILSGLEAVGLLPQNGTVHVDVLQVPHHGSIHNSDTELYERVTADHYVISADGIHHKHPDPATLDWIVDARGTDEYVIHLTNPITAALAHLEGLAPGKRFRVEHRTDPALGLEIDLTV